VKAHRGGPQALREQDANIMSSESLWGPQGARVGDLGLRALHNPRPDERPPLFSTSPACKPRTLLPSPQARRFLAVRGGGATTRPGQERVIITAVLCWAARRGGCWFDTAHGLKEALHERERRGVPWGSGRCDVPIV
jgi:hypothetical protein